jgi:parallel beta-helix repeat protein
MHICQNSVFNNSTIESNNIGIYGDSETFHQTKNNTIENNKINFNDEGIDFHTWTRLNRIRNNEFNSNRIGVEIWSRCFGNNITGNIFNSNFGAIRLWWQNDYRDYYYNNVINNTINSSSYGISVSDSLNVDVINNTILTNVSSEYGVGIYISGSENLEARGNIINASGSESYGIYMESVEGNQIEDNNIIQAKDAIVINVSLENNPINNNFTSNSFSNVNQYDLNIPVGGVNLTYFIDQPMGSYNINDSVIAIKDTTHGEVRFTEGVTETGTNLSDDIKMSNNLIQIDSSSKQGLNKSAILEFYNVDVTGNLIALRNGENCPGSICGLVNSLGGKSLSNFTFTVNSFTNYSVGNYSEVVCGSSITDIGNVFTLSNDMDCSAPQFGQGIGIGSSDIVLDCNGYKIFGGGKGNGVGISVSEAINFTIKNCNITEFGEGLVFNGAENGTIENNEINSNTYGIKLINSHGNNVINNTMKNNLYDFNVEGSLAEHYNNSIDSSNLVGARPIKYLYDKENLVYDGDEEDIGVFVCAVCDNVTIRDVNLASNNSFGVKLAFTNNSVVKNINVSRVEVGIDLRSSHNNVINESRANLNNIGVYIYRSSNNSVRNITTNLNSATGMDIFDSHNNTIESVLSNSNSQRGIYIRDSDFNIITNATVSSNTDYGVLFYDSSNNVINGSSRVNDTIYLYRNSNNNLIENNVVGNIQGNAITLDSSGGKYPSNNNFTNNTLMDIDGYDFYIADEGILPPHQKYP